MPECPASTRGAHRREAGGMDLMSYMTYILLSKIAKKTYVGHTDNLLRRLEEHNRGRSIFSSRYRPWVILYNESYSLEVDAVKREKYFNSAAGRRWIKKNLF